MSLNKLSYLASQTGLSDSRGLVDLYIHTSSEPVEFLCWGHGMRWHESDPLTFCPPEQGKARLIFSAIDERYPD